MHCATSLIELVVHVRYGADQGLGRGFVKMRDSGSRLLWVVDGILMQGPEEPFLGAMGPREECGDFFMCSIVGLADIEGLGNLYAVRQCFVRFLSLLLFVL